MTQATFIEGLRKHLRFGPKVLKKIQYINILGRIFYLHLAIKKLQNLFYLVPSYMAYICNI